MAAFLGKMTSIHAPTRRKAGETMVALLRNMTQNLSRDTTQINEVLCTLRELQPETESL